MALLHGEESLFLDDFGIGKFVENEHEHEG